MDIDPNSRPRSFPLRTVMIKCPKTGLPISTGIATGENMTLTSQYLNKTVQCPRCGEVHRWSGTEAFFGD